MEKKNLGLFFKGEGNVSFLPSLQDIARLLQLQEEKKHKKHYLESQGHTAYEDSYYAENGGMLLPDKASKSWQYRWTWWSGNSI